MSTFATVTLQVMVELETDPGLLTPDAYEPPYDYIAVRQVEHTAVELHGEPEAALLVDESDAYGLDPDGLLTAAVRTAILEGSGSSLFFTD